VRAGRGPLGILGGTFDPIHVGHLALAREAQRALGLERVLFVPNADPPHKDRDVTAPEHRAEMVRLAIEGEPTFVLSRTELDRPGPSYAVDTVAEVAGRSRAEGRPEPWFLLSVEAFRDLPSWRDPRRILELARLALAPRPGALPPDADWIARHFPGLEPRVTLLEGPNIDVSATDIRARIRRGQRIDQLVPAVVARYIEDRGLYGAVARSAPALASGATEGP
jgi:nicotinate-nucleotide adenylyltransferase